MKWNRVATPKLGVWLEKVTIVTHYPTIGVSGGHYKRHVYWTLRVAVWKRECSMRIEGLSV